LFHFGGTKRRDDDVHSSDGNGGGTIAKSERPRPPNRYTGAGPAAEKH
jgi:hypothetical protein